MVCITIIAGAILMIRPIFAANSESAAYSATFIANIYFWRNTAYFSPSSHIYMYLHTWSLAVEEQFYLIYPIFLVWVHHYFRSRAGAIVVTAVICSFFISLLFYWHASGWAFFLLPSRAWQLGLGAMVALGQFPSVKQHYIRAALAFTGLLLVIGSLVLVNQTWQIPAPWSLPASLGAALMIAYGDAGPTAKLLSVPPIAWIGTISYSLYLWHWPIIVLHNVTVGYAKTGWQIAALLASSVMAATISYYLVEQPAMRRLRPLPAVRIVIGSGGLIVALVLAVVSIGNLPESWSTFPPKRGGSLSISIMPRRHCHENSHGWMFVFQIWACCDTTKRIAVG